MSSSVIGGWRLSVTMLPRTPLEWLLRHGEYREGADAPNEEVPPQHAIWTPVTKSWAELEISLREPPLGTMASAVGQIPVDGGEFLPFLIRYRRIIEKGPPDDGQASLIKSLKEEFPHYSHVLEPRRKKAR